jgi:hypothetical protein
MSMINQSAEASLTLVSMIEALMNGDTEEAGELFENITTWIDMGDHAGPVPTDPFPFVSWEDLPPT